MRCVAFCLLAFCLSGAVALENGLALTPPLGYNTWNSFGPNIDEQLIRETANRMVSLGLKDMGYTYLNIDDGWSEPARKDGRLVGHKVAFPSGIKALSDYVHSKGLKFGIYGDAGAHTCAGYPGSRGFEEVDAQTWADWGVDYLKYDNCFSPAADWVIDRYAAMREAINKTGRDIVFSLCEWGVADPWTWAPEVGHSWRTTEDIEPRWDSILKILDYNTGLARFARKGAWNDPDMLEVGNGNLLLGEQRAHFALWALMKSPLLIGADLRSISPDSLAILKAREVIAINQDELGVAGDLVWMQGANRIYAAPLAGGGRALVMLNLHTLGGQYLTSNLTIFWEQLGLPEGRVMRVRDLYAEEDLGEASASFTAEVQAHDVRVLRLTPLRTPQADNWRPWHQQPIYMYAGEQTQQAGNEGSLARRIVRRMGPAHQHAMGASWA